MLGYLHLNLQVELQPGVGGQVAEFFGGSSKAERTHLSLLLSRKKMASIRDPVAVAGAVAPPAGTATLSELHGSAQAIRVLAPWIEVTGTGAADNPYSCSRADLSALMSCAAVLDNTVGGPAIVASRLSSAQMAALWDAVQTVGDGDSQEPLDLLRDNYYMRIVAGLRDSCLTVD